MTPKQAKDETRTPQEFLSPLRRTQIRPLDENGLRGPGAPLGPNRQMGNVEYGRTTVPLMGKQESATRRKSGFRLLSGERRGDGNARQAGMSRRIERQGSQGRVSVLNRVVQAAEQFQAKAIAACFRHRQAPRGQNDGVRLNWVAMLKSHLPPAGCAGPWGSRLK
jgi:hypothetical protein